MLRIARSPAQEVGMIGALLLAMALPVATDDPPGDIQGTWKLQVTRTWDGGGSTYGSANVTLTITGKAAEWPAGIPRVFLGAGKGVVKVGASAKPATIEIKVGDAVYKGVYAIRKGTKDPDMEYLDLLLSEPNGEAPKGFGPDRFKVPAGFTGYRVSGVRVN
jgi:hypothetical protein